MAKYKEICDLCGKVFYAGPREFVCPECRRATQSARAKQRNLSQIGRDAYSKQQAERKARADNGTAKD